MQYTIQTAIEQKRLLCFYYNDKYRVVEPHCLGVNKNGALMMRAFQVDGDGEGWKLFAAENIEGLSMSSTSFREPRPGFKTGDRAMTRIIAELAHEPAQA